MHCADAYFLGELSFFVSFFFLEMWASNLKQNRRWDGPEIQDSLSGFLLLFASIFS